MIDVQIEPGIFDDYPSFRRGLVLAVGIQNVIMMWSPEIIIFGGGVSNKLDFEKLATLVKQEMIMFPKLPEMVVSELGDKSGLYGALQYLKTAS